MNMKNQSKINSFDPDYNSILIKCTKINLEGLLRIFTKKNISIKIALQAKLETERKEFTFNRYIKNVEKITNQNFSTNEKKSLNQDFSDWFRDSLDFYEESMKVSKKIAMNDEKNMLEALQFLKKTIKRK